MPGIPGVLQRRLAGALAVLLLAGCGGEDSAPATATGNDAAVRPVVVYSSRAEQLIKPIFDAYTAETGVPIRYTTDSEQPLIQKLLAEGNTTPADLLITVDAGNLWYAAERGALRPTDSEVLRRNIPAHLRDPEDRWFALSVRARTIVYDTRDRSEEHTSELQSRENLVCRLLLYKT